MMPFARSSRIRRALTLATGQTTSYGSGAGVDDGGLEIGELHRYTVLISGQYSGTTAITINGKTDNHSNGCVVDETTGLMWSRTVSASVGPTSNGLIPWTTNANGEGIFPYVAAANAAGLAGYSNWRIPNYKELVGIMDYEAPSGLPDATAFPTIASGIVITTSTTQPTNSSNPMSKISNSGTDAVQAKTVTVYCLLVRGPV